MHVMPVIFATDLEQNYGQKVEKLVNEKIFR